MIAGQTLSPSVVESETTRDAGRKGLIVIAIAVLGARMVLAEDGSF